VTLVNTVGLDQFEDEDKLLRNVGNCVISKNIAVRMSDVLRSVRNVRYATPGVRERNDLLLPVQQKVLQQCR